MTNIEWFKQVFLKHMRRAKPERGSFVDFFVQMFRLKERSIDTLVCTKDHELRGAVWKDAKPIEGLIERRVLMMKKGQHIWLREDEGENFVTLENSRGCVNILKADWYSKFRKYYGQTRTN